MNHADHVALLKDGIPNPGGVWADLGSGTGAFTLALADLLGPQGEIYSLDRDPKALRAQQAALQQAFPTLTVHYLQADYSRPPDLPPLDGLIMANSLHFQRHKEPILQRLRLLLNPDGRFILVEYNVDQGNLWVPHPISFPSWQRLAPRCGYTLPRLLAARPSRFLKEIYSALCFKVGD